MGGLQRLKIDKFLLVMISVVIVASQFPCEGDVNTGFEYLTTAAIALLFFMHGARLSRDAIVAGMGHRKLHVVVFLSTFVLFPLLGLAMGVLSPTILNQPLYMGFLYLCALPALLVVYVVFSEAVVQGIWHQVDSKRAVPGKRRGDDGVAVDDIPPGVTDGLRGVGAALCA